jgi:hypothetical protein
MLTRRSQGCRPAVDDLLDRFMAHIDQSLPARARQRRVDLNALQPAFVIK